MASKKNPVMVLDGADELTAALHAVGNRATGFLVEVAANKGADVLVEEMKARAPVKTGRLRGGITKRTERVQQGRAVVGVGPDKRHFWAIFLELGTKWMAARPFMRPTLDEKKDDATKAVGESLKGSLRDVLN